jgi:hypothetical protein
MLSDDVTVFYPAMGVDIFTPLMCVPNVDKIIATGPIPSEKFGKGALETTIRYVCNFINYGTNEFYEGKYVDEDEFIEFLPDEGQITKKYNFKSKGLYLVTFKYRERNVKLYYYYKSEPLDEKYPFTDKFDYVIHKGFKMPIYPTTKRKKTLIKNLKNHLKPNTILIANKNDIRSLWRMPKSSLEGVEPNEGYEFIVKQTTYRSEGPFDHLYEVPLVLQD